MSEAAGFDCYTVLFAPGVFERAEQDADWLRFGEERTVNFSPKVAIKSLLKKGSLLNSASEKQGSALKAAIVSEQFECE